MNRNVNSGERMCSTPLWSSQKILYQLWKSSKPLNLRRRKQQRKKCFHLWLKSPNGNCVSNVEKSSGPFPAKAAFLIESPLVWHHLNEARRDTKRPLLVRIAGSQRVGAPKHSCAFPIWSSTCCQTICVYAWTAPGIFSSVPLRVSVFSSAVAFLSALSVSRGADYYKQKQIKTNFPSFSPSWLGIPFNKDGAGTF